MKWNLEKEWQHKLIFEFQNLAYVEFIFTFENGIWLKTSIILEYWIKMEEVAQLIL